MNPLKRDLESQLDNCRGYIKAQAHEIRGQAAEIQRLTELLDHAILWIQQDCPFSKEHILEILQREEDDGQPDEAQEWHDFDPDC